MSKRIVFFNHKGGVSKTTSVFNVGWMLAEQGKRVLLVDGDPQCNLTSLILGDDFEKYYVDEATRLNNIKDGVDSAFSGKPKPIESVECKSPVRQPNLFLLAGHENLSELDASLSLAQNTSDTLTVLQNLPGAFNELLNQTEKKYSIDYTLIDLNPGLSAINQNLFLSSDAFVVPTNPDPFSLMALDTLSLRLPKWVSWKARYFDFFSDSAYPMRDGTPIFLGAIIQRFNIRNGRAAAPYRDNIQDIKSKISTTFFDRISMEGMTFPRDKYPQHLSAGNFCYDLIPDFQGLLPKAREAGVPVYKVTDEELREVGVVLDGLKTKRAEFNRLFAKISKEMIEVLDV